MIRQNMFKKIILVTQYSILLITKFQHFNFKITKYFLIQAN